jgi:hypothetical protein
MVMHQLILDEADGFIDEEEKMMIISCLLRLRAKINAAFGRGCSR